MLQQAQAKNLEWEEKYNRARHELLGVGEARAAVESMEETHEALRVSLASACAATQDAEERAKKAEIALEAVQNECLQQELVHKQLLHDTAAQRTRADLQATRLVEAEGEIENLNQQMREQAVQLQSGADMKHHYERQLADANALMQSQRQMMDSLRDMMEHQSMSGNQDGMGLDLASETQAAEVETLMQEVATLNKSVLGQENRQEQLLREMKQQLGAVAQFKDPAAEIAELREFLTLHSPDQSRNVELERAVAKAEASQQTAEQEVDRLTHKLERLRELEHELASRAALHASAPVSYTHLTLPTKRIV
eukprot:TRINITY_DN30452_c0_g1_i2.p1 TRINITY_DN30452_c0_g1~~TRINITY_DN30452_c0_g1_i2.p1  ORF type:complete len:310 (-),score=93.45 TRINITY_DN30452_c0_g1_i2:80-1009(-)